MNIDALIIFPNEWVAYSPTILNLVNLLPKTISARVIAIDNGKYDNSSLNGNVYKLIKIPLFLGRLLAIIHLYDAAKFALLLYHARYYKPKSVIGVDNIGVCVAQNAFSKGHFLSLEIKKDIFLAWAIRSNIESVAIQSMARYNYIFSPDTHYKTHIIPNSPIADPRRAGKILSKTHSEFSPKIFKAVLFGNAKPSHGVYICCEALREFQTGILTIKGVVSKSVQNRIYREYADLIESGRLVIDNVYVDQNDVVSYLSQFDIGFCFYDMNLIKNNDYNYISSPSGKMYAYFAARVPVIGSDLIGLNPVREYNAGILLAHPDTKSVALAISTILCNLPGYMSGCDIAASDLEFSRHAVPYLKDVLSLGAWDNPDFDNVP